MFVELNINTINFLRLIWKLILISQMWWIQVICTARITLPIALQFLRVVVGCHYKPTFAKDPAAFVMVHNYLASQRAHYQYQCQHLVCILHDINIFESINILILNKPTVVKVNFPKYSKFQGNLMANATTCLKFRIVWVWLPVKNYSTEKQP